MKKNYIIILALVIGNLISVQNVWSQCKTKDPNKNRPFYVLETECAKNNSEPSYLAAGKEYRALLNGSEAVDFIVIFFANNKYRIAACTDVGGPLSFTVKDQSNNMLFTNINYKNAPYWDLSFSTTIECIVTIQLPPETIKMAGGAPSEGNEKASKDTAKAAESESASNIGDVCSVLVIGYKQE